jgi:hypothetical protein
VPARGRRSPHPARVRSHSSAGLVRYNIDGSWIYQSASKLKSFSDLKFAPLLGANDDVAADHPTELTFEMKTQLNQNANLLSSKDLYGMVGIVEVRRFPAFALGMRLLAYVEVRRRRQAMCGAMP